MTTPIGHALFTYILTRQFKLKRRDVAALIFFSVLPDIDLLIPFINHRTVTHSLVTVGAIFLLWYLTKEKYALFAGLGFLSHIFLDVWDTYAFQILWPLPYKFSAGIWPPLEFVWPVPLDPVYLIKVIHPVDWMMIFLTILLLLSDRVKKML